MGSHRAPKASIFKRFTRRQWIGIAAGAVAVSLIAVGGITTQNLYAVNSDHSSVNKITSYSATESDAAETYAAVSRGDARTAIKEGRGGADANTSYVKVVINGQSRLVLSEGFTNVKSVLEAGAITLEPEDTVSPSLDTKVTESTVVTIERSGSTVETSEKSIPFNTIKKETDSLPKGTTKVQQEGKKGMMQYTNLVTKAGSTVSESNTLTSWIKKAPVDKIVLVGTGETSSSSSSSSSSGSSNYGTTTPVGEAQNIAHKKLIAKGWDESQFTCLVQLWQKESGWSTTAHNPSSGAHGIPQALPGSKMGAGWESDANVQITWGLNYIAERYSTPCGAWGHSQSTGWY